MTKRKNTIEATQAPQAQAPLRRGPQRARSLTASQFDELIPLLDIHPTRIEAARLYLVNGMTMSGVAEAIAQAHGIDQTRQSVNDSVQVVWRVYERFQAAKSAGEHAQVPEGWVKLTVVAPQSIVSDIHALVAAAAQNASRANPKAKPRSEKNPQKQA
jgi:hypothetical protein